MGGPGRRGNRRDAPRCFGRLTNASLGGRLEIIKALIETLGVDVDAADWYGWTALMLAASRGHIDAVNALRRHGATR